MKVILFPIEPLETRYTCEWYTELPKQLVAAGLNVISIEGKEISSKPSAGAFLDFSATNVYKSSQLISFAESVFRFVEDGDVILFTDAWNPCAIQVRYMLQLAKKKCRMIGLWHAGSYDPYDFLGRAFDKQWSYPFEEALYNCYDVNAFATCYSRDRMLDAIFGLPEEKAVTLGWPMEYLRERIKRGEESEKRDIVLFPHRISEEKRPDVFRMLQSMLPKYEFIFCQEQELTKAEYHKLLQSAKVVFSASNQETLGIGVYEGLLAGAAPLMPYRLSYKEIWSQHQDFLYETGIENTENGLRTLASKITELMTDDARRQQLVTDALNDEVVHSFYDGQMLYDLIKHNK